MTTVPAFIPVRATEQLVDALNKAIEIDGDVHARITLLLRTLQRLMHRDARCALWVLDDLDREPAPRIRNRTVVLPDGDSGPTGGLETAQQALDTAAPLTRGMLRTALKSLRKPHTVILSQAADAEWFRDVLVKDHLSATGTVDCLTSMWASSPKHAIFLVVHRGESDPPFSSEEQTMASLALRAIAPFADRDMVRLSSSKPVDELSQREREILLMLLAGDSEKQIAANISRSTHTVHTFVTQIYRQFEVSSRGELMAQFVDQAALENLRESVDR